jgi:hypothetical protein
MESEEPRITTVRIIRTTFLAVGVGLGAYAVVSLYFIWSGDLGESCRDATEISVDHDKNIYCSVDVDGSIRVHSKDGRFLRRVYIQSLSGGFAMRAADDAIEIYVFRTRSQVRLYPDGHQVAVGARGSLPPELRDYPKHVATRDGARYALMNGEVTVSSGGVTRTLVASRVPAFVPAVGWFVYLTIIGSMGAFACAMVTTPESARQMWRVFVLQYKPWRWRNRERG